MHGRCPEPSGIGINGRVGVHAGVGQGGGGVHVAVGLDLLDQFVVFGRDAGGGFGLGHELAQPVDHEAVVVGVPAKLRLIIIWVLL